AVIELVSCSLHDALPILKLNDFEEEPIEWCCGSGAVVYRRGEDDVLFPASVLVPTTVYISLFFTEQYDLTEIIQGRKTVQVEVYNITTSTTEFTGWLEPWNASHPYQAPGYEVVMVATCGLGR